jgi:hypothetical protein
MQTRQAGKTLQEYLYSLRLQAYGSTSIYSTGFTSYRKQILLLDNSTAYCAGTLIRNRAIARNMGRKHGGGSVHALHYDLQAPGHHLLELLF